MRRRLLRSMVAITLAVLCVVGVAMGYLADRAALSNEKLVVQREAATVGFVVQRVAGRGQVLGPEDVDGHLDPGDRLEVRGMPQGDLVVGDPLDGKVLSAAVTTRDGVEVQIERAAPTWRERIVTPGLIMVSVAAAAIGAAWLLSAQQARRLTRPIEELTRYGRRLGSGDLTGPVPRSGVEEIDELAAGLEAGSARIDALVRAERAFATNASHQLRSALTGLSLSIEALADHEDPQVQVEAVHALAQVERLHATVEDLLRLARTGGAGERREFELLVVVRDHVDEWQRLAGPGRPITVEGVPDRDPPGLDQITVTAAPGPVGQVLDILLANAVEHGSGRVVVRLDASEELVAVSVEDEGPGIPGVLVPALFRRAGEGPHGIGLALARELAASEGGTVELVEAEIARFELVLPRRPSEPSLTKPLKT